LSASRGWGPQRRARMRIARIPPPSGLPVAAPRPRPSAWRRARWPRACGSGELQGEPARVHPSADVRRRGSARAHRQHRSCRWRAGANEERLPEQAAGRRQRGHRHRHRAPASPAAPCRGPPLAVMPRPPPFRAKAPARVLSEVPARVPATYRAPAKPCMHAKAPVRKVASGTNPPAAARRRKATKATHPPHRRRRYRQRRYRSRSSLPTRTAALCGHGTSASLPADGSRTVTAAPQAEAARPRSVGRDRGQIPRCFRTPASPRRSRS